MGNLRRIMIGTLIGLLFGLAGCQEGEVIVPTRAQPNAVQTDIVKTQNAPPPGFDSIAFDPVDENRADLPGSYFEVNAHFQGQYTASGNPAEGSMVMRVWENGINRARRVQLEFSGDALSTGFTRLEGVRLGNDFYLLDANGVCSQNSESAREIANLSAGRIVGGFRYAVPMGVKSLINAVEGFQYGFALEDVTVNIFSQPPGAMDITAGEAWLLPQFNVIGRYGVVMNVHNARILFGAEAVTGQLDYQYNLYDISETEAEVENISIPNGC